MPQVTHRKTKETEVHGYIMEEVEVDEYLGDLVSNDGRNTKNIESRVSRGLEIALKTNNQ